MTIQLEVPLPPASLSPNARTHWAAKASAVKQYRQTVCILALQATKSTRPMLESSEISYEFFCGPTADRRARPRDIDNAIGCMKSAVDGLRDAGILLDDSAEHVKIGEVKLRCSKALHGGRACVVVRVKAL